MHVKRVSRIEYGTTLFHRRRACSAGFKPAGWLVFSSEMTIGPGFKYEMSFVEKIEIEQLNY